MSANRTKPLPRQRRIHFVHSVHRGLILSLRAAAFPATMLNFLSPHTQSMHSTFPSQIASFRWSIIPAGRTSQKRLEQGPKIDPFPSPHHQTTPPLPLTSGPWPHHVLYWLGTGWWRLGLARASLLNLSKRLPAAHVSAVTWRLSFCVFWPFMWAFFWFFASIRNWASYDDGLYISCAYLLFFFAACRFGL